MTVVALLVRIPQVRRRRVASSNKVSYDSVACHIFTHISEDDIFHMFIDLTDLSVKRD